VTQGGTWARPRSAIRSRDRMMPSMQRPAARRSRQRVGHADHLKDETRVWYGPKQRDQMICRWPRPITNNRHRKAEEDDKHRHVGS